MIESNLSSETRFALSVMVALLDQTFAPCFHRDSEELSEYPCGSAYHFTICRCRKCGETTAALFGNFAGHQIALATLPTRIAPYATNRPSAGYAYYWRFDGLNHSTGPIVPEEPTP